MKQFFYLLLLFFVTPLCVQSQNCQDAVRNALYLNIVKEYEIVSQKLVSPEFTEDEKITKFMVDFISLFESQESPVFNDFSSLYPEHMPVREYVNNLIFDYSKDNANATILIYTDVDCSGFYYLRGKEHFDLFLRKNFRGTYIDLKGMERSYSEDTWLKLTISYDWSESEELPKSLKIRKIEQDSKPFDPDADWLLVPEDKCPYEIGPRSNNGCPEKAPDKDGDGTPDSLDDCPQVKGPPSNNGCPVEKSDVDNDGVPDESDECKDLPGPPSNNGCPIGGPKPPEEEDDDDDGILNYLDHCPNVPGPRKNGGCPVYTPSIAFGLSASFGWGLPFIFNGDPDITGIGGFGVSPSANLILNLSNNVFLNIDLAYNFLNMEYSNLGDDSEYSIDCIYDYNFEGAYLSISSARAYAKINFSSLYIGAYYGRILSAKRSKELQYDLICSNGDYEQFFYEDFSYDFFDETEYPKARDGSRAINLDDIGITAGFEKIMDSGFFGGIGFDLSVINFINNNYSGWLEDGDSIDFYPATEIKMLHSYGYLKIGYVFNYTRY